MEAPHIFQTPKCLKNGAKQKPRFLLSILRSVSGTSLCHSCELTILSGTKLGAEGARQGERQGGRESKRPWAKRNKIKLRWSFIPLSGFATDGEPRTCQRSRTAERSKDFFSIYLVPPCLRRWAPRGCCPILTKSPDILSRARSQDSLA